MRKTATKSAEALQNVTLEHLAKIHKNSVGVGTDECWTKCTTGEYTRVCVAYRVYMAAHRVVYKLFHPEWDGEGVVMHTCDNPPCWNPDHLVLGTVKQNNQDCLDKKRRIPYNFHLSSDTSWCIVKLFRQGRDVFEISKRMKVSVARVMATVRFNRAMEV